MQIIVTSLYTLSNKLIEVNHLCNHHSPTSHTSTQRSSQYPGIIIARWVFWHKMQSLLQRMAQTGIAPNCMQLNSPLLRLWHQVIIYDLYNIFSLEHFFPFRFSKWPSKSWKQLIYPRMAIDYFIEGCNFSQRMRIESDFEKQDWVNLGFRALQNRVLVKPLDMWPSETLDPINKPNQFNGKRLSFSISRQQICHLQ